VLLLFRRGATLETVRMPGGTIPPHDGHGPLHMAFAVAADALPQWEQRLRERGIAVEGRTSWSRGGRSIYFRDPDGHLLELATPGFGRFISHDALWNSSNGLAGAPPWPSQDQIRCYFKGVWIPAAGP
jgi:hypothetical protein